jgi:Protein of unknown function (DUF3618)
VSTPQQIQQDIEGTRRALSTDVDRLAEKVSPGRVVSRRVDRVKSGAASMREKIMGTLPDPEQVKGRAGDAASSVGGAASSVTDKASDLAGNVGDAVTGAPQAVKRQAQGNPLGAGLVAFGVGLVLSSLIPATDAEKQVAARTEDAARGPAQDKAKEIATPLMESAQQSAQQVKDAATSAASETMDQARSAAEDVKAPLQQ